MHRVRRSVRLAVVVGSLCASTAPPAAAHPGLDEVEARVEAASAERPDDPAVHLRHAVVHRRRGRWHAAVAAYVRAAELGADRDEVDSALAQVLLRAGDPLAAERHAEAVLARRPDLAMALLTRARIRKALGRDAAAGEDFGRAVQMLPRPEPALVVEAMQQLLAGGDADAALTVGDAAMRKLGVVVTIQLPAIEIERRCSRFDQALARIDELLEQSPRHVQWLALRGEILDDAGRAGEAADVYRGVLALIADLPVQRRAARIVALESRLRARLAAGRDAQAHEGAS